MTNEKKFPWAKIAGVLLLIAGMLLIILLAPKRSLWAWILSIVLFVILFVAIGKKCGGEDSKWFQVLIDERNSVSLSRFQMTLWTILFLSSFFTAALINIFANKTNPLDIDIPAEFWVLIGISATSLVGSALVKQSQYKIKKILLIVSPKNPSFCNMFKGEQTTNADNLDLSKIQMFFLTIVVLIVYAVALGDMFVKSYSKIIEFPPFHESLLILIGISHAGYLTYKAIPHEKFTSEEEEKSKSRTGGAAST